MKDNPNRRKAVIWAVITTLAILATIVHIFGVHDYSSNYPLILLGLLIIDSISIILIVYYIKQTRLLDRILQGDSHLAHWTYSQKEWDRYTETDYRAANRKNREWYYTFAAAALICGILFVVFKQEPKRPLFIILFCIFAPVPLVMWFSAWNNYRRNKKHPGEAYIMCDAVYLNGRLVTWRGPGRELESVVVADNESQQLLVITYSDEGKSKITYTSRVPVPRGQEKAAMEIAEKLNHSK